MPSCFLRKTFLTFMIDQERSKIGVNVTFITKKNPANPTQEFSQHFPDLRCVFTNPWSPEVEAPLPHTNTSIIEMLVNHQMWASGQTGRTSQLEMFAVHKDVQCKTRRCGSPGCESTTAGKHFTAELKEPQSLWVGTGVCERESVCVIQKGKQKDARGLCVVQHRPNTEADDPTHPRLYYMSSKMATTSAVTFSWPRHDFYKSNVFVKWVIEGFHQQCGGRTRCKLINEGVNWLHLASFFKKTK